MKQLIFLFILLFLPLIISAQQMNDQRTPLFSDESCDSLLKELLPNAENWRQTYNNKEMNQLTPFFLEKPRNNSTNSNEFAFYSANFQKKMNDDNLVDSLLIFSMNSTCDEASLYTKQIGKADSQKVDNLNILRWKNMDGKWLTVSHFEALKD
jgi:hypothetical protein